MKLLELDDQTPDTETPEPTDNIVGSIIEYSPDVVTDKKGRTQHLLKLYSAEEGHTGNKAYRLESIDPIRIKILSTSHDDEDRIYKVRFLTDPERLVTRYSTAHKEVTPDAHGDPITFKWKYIPDIRSYDHLTDQEFYNKMGRRRMLTDYGMIGFVYVSPEDIDELEFNEPQADTYEPTTDGSFSSEESSNSKLDQAIEIYKANKRKPRQQVVAMIKDKLDMSSAGGSSYYTKAMHAVEDD